MSQQLAIIQFSDDQLKLVRETVAKGTTPEQFRLFIEVCRLSGLNPFARQIYAVVRQGQMAIQTSIDGYRLLAERSGKYGGQVGPQWCAEDGVWHDVWLSDKAPAAARVGIVRKDFSQPVWGVAKYKSYAQNSPLWTKMPDLMLSKCAESLALRKAFPAEMSGIYTREEMEQADNDAPLPTVAPVVPDAQVVESEPVEQSITDQQKASIRKLCQHLQQDVPSDMDTMSYATAKALIAVLSEDYRNSHTPAKTSNSEAVTELKAYVARVFSFKPEKAEERWNACKVHVLGNPVEDATLEKADIDKIRGFATAEEQRKATHASSGK